jgi:hypothetical protein
MSAVWATLAVAVLGLAGTLLSPLIGQRIAARAKEQEFDLQRRQRQEEREAGQRQAEFEGRRSIYARLNTAARQYQQALGACARAMPDGAAIGEARAELADARQTFRDLYSDAQMILPDRVLQAAMSVSTSLGEAYGMIKRLEIGEPRIRPGVNQAETAEMAREFTHKTVYNQILELRRLMREDLGVSGQ